MSSTFKIRPSLSYLVRRPKIEADRPPLLLLLHGVGSNEKDLFSFADSLPDKYLVVSVRGPLTFNTGSYAWFHVDFSSGRPLIVAEEAEYARQAILQFIDDLKAVEVFDDQQVWMMGFSQGGIMSYSVALTAPEKIKGIAVMSGRLLPEVRPFIASAEKLSRLKIYISHGTGDRVLPVQYALDAVAYLREKGLAPVLHTYEEGHTISGRMLKDVVDWLGA